MQNRPTIRNIVRLSGVGESTVSRVLNNENGVGRRTRERVGTVTQRHGFSPSCSARVMRDQNGKMMIIIVTRLDSPSGNLAVQTMLPAFYERGYDPIMMESQFSPGLAEEHLDVLTRRNIDGMVLLGFTSTDEAMLAPWHDILVLMAHDAPGFAPVCYDDEGAVTLLMQRLYGRGHHHISFLGVPHSDVATGERRHLAYLTFYKEHRLTPTAALPGLGMRQGYDTVASVLTAEADALVYATDTPALGASKYLQQQGRTTLQLASVGSTPLTEFLHPEILTINPGCAESGHRATRQLVGQIAGSVEPRQIVIPAALD